MEKIKKFLGDLFASIALNLGVLSVNSACVLYVYQPKVPKSIYKYKK